MKRTALIAFASLTKNTELIGRTFAEVFEQYGIEATVAKFETKYKGQTTVYYPEDYDFLCLGSLIIACLPYEKFNVVCGIQDDFASRNIEFRRREDGVLKKKKQYGIAFCTYGGTFAGPRECVAALEVLSSYLKKYNHAPVGQFACGGKEILHNSVDNLGSSLNINISEAQAMMTRFRENPSADEFKNMTPDMLKSLEKLTSVKDEDSFGYALLEKNDPLGCGLPGAAFWHYNMTDKPNERDLKKARIFLGGIIKDYFLTEDGVPREPISTYKCIS